MNEWVIRWHRCISDIYGSTHNDGNTKRPQIYEIYKLNTHIIIYLNICKLSRGQINTKFIIVVATCVEGNYYKW